MSDTLQSISISQTPLEQEIQKMNAILPDVLKTLEESGTKKSWEMFFMSTHEIYELSKEDPPSKLSKLFIWSP